MPDTPNQKQNTNTILDEDIADTQKQQPSQQTDTISSLSEQQVNTPQTNSIQPSEAGVQKSINTQPQSNVTNSVSGVGSTAHPVSNSAQTQPVQNVISDIQTNAPRVDESTSQQPVSPVKNVSSIQDTQQEAKQNTDHFSKKNNKPTVVTIALLVFTYPIGVFVMWFWPKWKLWIKMLLTVPLFILLTVLILGLFGVLSNPFSNNRDVDVSPINIPSVCETNCLDLYPNRGSGYANCLSTCSNF